jgi:hypothetical protein
MAGWRVIAVALSVLALSGATAQATTARTALSIGAKIAELDCGCPVSDSTPGVVLYRRAFAVLASKCTERPIRLADHIEFAHRYLASRGYSVTRLYIMRQINRSIPRSVGRTRCADVVAAWLILVTKG